MELTVADILAAPTVRTVWAGVLGRWVTWDKRAIYKCLNKKLLFVFLTESEQAQINYKVLNVFKDRILIFTFKCFWLHLI